MWSHLLYLSFSSVPPNPLRISINPVGSPIAGNAYELLCEATVAEGIQTTPHIHWDGYSPDSSGDITVSNAMFNGLTTTLPLEFSVLRVTHAGNYTCQATLYSTALDSPLTVTEATTLNVESMLTFLVKRRQLLITVVCCYTYFIRNSVFSCSLQAGYCHSECPK